MSVPIRNRQSHHDPIARAHHRAGIIRATAIVVGIGTILGTLGWGLFFSSLFAVTDIRVSGAPTIGDERVHAFIQELLDRRTLQMFQPARNMILLDTEAMSARVKASYDNIGSVSVRKRYRHTLEIVITERIASGVWCRDGQCTYFDREGARWGSAVPSRGPLLTRVQDERGDTKASGGMLIRNMFAAIDGISELGLRVFSITLPNAASGDMRLEVNAPYDLFFDANGDITDQLATLAVLLSDKAKDTAWASQYIDLRTPGRIYYR